MRIYKELPYGGTVMGMSEDELKYKTQKEIFNEMDRFFQHECLRKRDY